MNDPNCSILFASYAKNKLGSFTRSYGLGPQQHCSLHFIIDAHAELQIAAQGQRHSYALAGAWLWAGYPGPDFTQIAGSPLPRGHYRVALRGNQINNWIATGLWPQAPLPIHNPAVLSTCFEHLLRSLHGLTRLHQQRRSHAVEGILLEAATQQEQAPEQALWLSRCCTLLDAEIANHAINYAALADTLYIPLPTLRRHFRLAMGQALHAYVLQQRCQRAQNLLLSSDATVEQIANQLGYIDAAYFSRQFKQQCGLSPSALRQQRYF